MERILLVEDSKDYQNLVKDLLGNRCEIVCTRLSSDALKELEKRPFDLVLLDVLLPDGDGFELFARMKTLDASRDTPVVFLTGKGGVVDRVTGFSLGADDYVVKPFEPLEFRARIEAKLNRLRQRQEGQQSVRKGDLLLKIPFQRGYIVKGADEIDLDLTPLEFKLLLYFFRHEEHVLSRNQLLNSVWGQNVYVQERTVDQHIYYLRQKLRDKAHYVKTVPSVGYRFSTKK